MIYTTITAVAYMMTGSHQGRVVPDCNITHPMHQFIEGSRKHSAAILTNQWPWVLSSRICLLPLSIVLLQSLLWLPALPPCLSATPSRSSNLKSVKHIKESLSESQRYLQRPWRSSSSSTKVALSSDYKQIHSPNIAHTVLKIQLRYQ